MLCKAAWRPFRGGARSMLPQTRASLLLCVAWQLRKASRRRCLAEGLHAPQPARTMHI